MEYRPLINYSLNEQPKHKRQSNMVALARLFMIVAPIALLVGLYWRLV